MELGQLKTVILRDSLICIVEMGQIVSDLVYEAPVKLDYPVLAY